MRDPSIASVRSILHQRVKSLEGEGLGCIEDLIFDPERGLIAYAVLAMQDLFPRASKKYFIIPWSTLTLDPADQTLVLGMDGEALRSAPGLDRADLAPAPGSQHPQMEESCVPR